MRRGVAVQGGLLHVARILQGSAAVSCFLRSIAYDTLDGGVVSRTRAAYPMAHAYSPLSVQRRLSHMQTPSNSTGLNPQQLATEVQAMKEELQEMKSQVKEMFAEVKSMKAKRHAIEAFLVNAKHCRADVDTQAFQECQTMSVPELKERHRVLDQDIRVKEQRIDVKEQDIRVKEQDIRVKEQRIDVKETDINRKHADKVTAEWSLHNLPSYKSIVSTTLAFDLVELPQGAKWSTTVRKDALVVRKSHYAALWNRVQKASVCGDPSERAVLISGNPGIGKTWCLEYLLLRSLEEVPDRLVFVIGDTLSLYRGDEVFRLDRLSKLAECLPHTQNKEILILHDIKHGSNLTYSSRYANHWTDMGLRVTIVVAASPQEGNTKDFMKDFYKAARFFMPMWSLEETVEYARRFEKKSEEEAKSAFYHVGGAPRVVVRYFCPDNGVLDEQANKIRKITWDAFYDSPSQLTDESSKVVGLFPTSNYAKFNVDFVSLYARELWHKVHVSKEGAMLVEMEQRGLRDALGRFFELAVRRRLATEGLCFEQLPDASKGKAKKPVVKGQLQHWPGTGGSVTERLYYGNDLRSVLVSRGKHKDDGKKKTPATGNVGTGGYSIPDSVLYVPRNCNFPAGDFLFEQPDGVWVVQVTVSNRKKPAPAYEELLQQLDDCDKAVLGIVWVVSVDADPVRRVRITAKRRIDEKKMAFPLFDSTPQYVCKVDYRKNMQWAMDVTVEGAPRVVWFHTTDGVHETDSHACQALKDSSPIPIKTTQKFVRVLDDGVGAVQDGSTPRTAFRFKLV